MKLEDIVKFILALLGIGGVAVLSTGAWSTPQGSVYMQLLPAQQWLYAGDTAQCIWEVHPTTAKTINSVSYGAPGSWTACLQNPTDFLLWNCSSVTVAEGSVACPGIRVVQNEFPGTSEVTSNQSFIFKTASVKGSRFPGCASADCVITSGASIPAGTYFMRNLKIDAAMTFTGNTSLVVMENFTIGTTGSISITSASTAYGLNITAYQFSNLGTISGKGNDGSPGRGYGSCQAMSAGGVGYPGSTIYIDAGTINNTGLIELNGGTGGVGKAVCYGSCSGYCCGSAMDGGAGGAGGNLIVNASTTNIISMGSVTLFGGAGGNGASCCYGQAAASGGGAGGAAGRITVNGLNYTSSSTLSAYGGTGGDGSDACFLCGTGGAGGAGKTNIIESNGNISISQPYTATGGAGGVGGSGCASGSTGASGIWSVPYCANGTGMDWTKFSPIATSSLTTCLTKPFVNFTSPNATSSFTAYLQNISVNASQLNNMSLLISFSKDNGSTWEWLSQDIYSLPYNWTNNGTPHLDTHRQGSDTANYSLMRVIAYNNTSKIYSDPVIVRFNLSNIQANVTGSSSPSGSISTNTILFTCNYTNSSNSIEAATAYIMLDGVSYPMTFSPTTYFYYWNNNQTLLAGAHNWSCIVGKANYKYATMATTTFNVTGFGIVYPGGQTTVKLSCPFPTISGMTPAGQKAGIGIFRIVNYNNTVLHNYSIFLNNTLPSGITIYSRCDRFSPQLTGWTALSTSTGYKGLININSTNSTAYCWLRMDCVSATPGTYTPFDYIFTEE